MKIEQLRDIQYSTIDSPIKSVEINSVEACTRRCGFCPRSDSKKYPVTNNRITVDTCRNIANQLKELNFSGRVGFVGFGEPLLSNNLEECISVIKGTLPNIKYIEINTNADLLTPERIKSLDLAGCTNISVSMYDFDITEKIENMRGDSKIEFVYRHQYDEKVNFNMSIIDRKNITYGDKILNIERPCYIPFYKLLIDWNGNLLSCQNDWARYTNFGNVNTSTIANILQSEEYVNFLRNLTLGKREQLPCSKCNICGTLRGKAEFDNFIEKLKR